MHILTERGSPLIRIPAFTLVAAEYQIKPKVAGYRGTCGDRFGSTHLRRLNKLFKSKTKISRVKFKKALGHLFSLNDPDLYTNMFKEEQCLSDPIGPPETKTTRSLGMTHLVSIQNEDWRLQIKEMDNVYYTMLGSGMGNRYIRTEVKTMGDPKYIVSTKPVTRQKVATRRLVQKGVL